MKALRRSMAEFHTWSGLLLGWLMFAMFTTGTAAYFQHEITRWMEPELVIAPTSPAAAAVSAVDYLEQEASGAASWSISLPTERQARTTVRWSSGERGAPRESRVLDGAGEEISVRETRGGNFLYRFHFDLHYIPVLWGRILVGIAAMFMLVALISGVITHRAIFVRFFTLKMGKGVTSWYDAHNMTAIFALPFFLMITYTGLVTLATLYMPAGMLANFTDRGSYFNAIAPRAESQKAAGEPAPLAPIGPMILDAESRWDGVSAESITIRHPGDANALVQFRRSRTGSIGTRMPTLTYSGVTGEPMGETARPSSGPIALESVLVGVHAGRFASVGLRWMYFLSGALGIAMIGTGLVQWTSRRRKRLAESGRVHYGFWLVERLNIGVVAGLGAGLAGFFLANRLLPLSLAERSEWEVHCLFIAWGAVLAWAVVRPAARAWPESLGLAAALFAAVPVVNMATTERGLPASLMSGDGVYLAFDLMMLILAAAYGWAARAAARSPATAGAPREKPATVRLPPAPAEAP